MKKEEQRTEEKQKRKLKLRLTTESTSVWQGEWIMHARMCSSVTRQQNTSTKVQ